MTTHSDRRRRVASTREERPGHPRAQEAEILDMVDRLLRPLTTQGRLQEREAKKMA